MASAIWRRSQGGLLLKGAAMLQCGAQQQYSWKTWSVDEQETLRWDLKRIMSSVGYTFETPAKAIGKRYAQMMVAQLDAKEQLPPPLSKTSQLN